MMNNKRLLAGVALGCLLSTPSAFAEEYRGFYFGIWGGSGEFSDVGSEAGMDQMTRANLPGELASIPIQPLTNLTASPQRSDLDDSLTPWGLQVGYRFNQWVAAEVGYVDLGELLFNLTGSISGPYAFVCDDCGEDGEPAVVTTLLNGDFERGTQITSSGVTASVLGMFPIGPRFDVHVRGGIYYADTRVTDRLRYMDAADQEGVFNLLHSRVDASQTELLAGIGAAWNINENFALRVEYQKFFDVGDDEKAGESDVDVFNVAVLFK